MAQPKGPRPVRNDLTGQKIPGSRWTVISRNYDSASRPSDRGVFWNVVCDCGNTAVVKTGNLLGGLSRSCGCWAKERTSETRTTHGMTNTFVYRCWRNMKSRCNNPKSTEYHNYGGRGIKVCDRWSISFENFYSDVGEPPTPQHSLDRIDVNGDYTPDNVRWATAQEQSENRRKIAPIENFTTEELVTELRRRGVVTTF